MTNQQHSITPPPELLDQWCMENNWRDIAIQAAQWGADQELEACVEWFDNQSLVYHRDLEHTFRTARRPKTPSLKDQALQVLASAPGPDYPKVMTVLNADEHALIRQALEALPND
jgi:hypothetical protein